MTAAHGGDLELVRTLIASGVELDHTAKHGLSALMLAVIGGHIEIVRALVQAGARQDLRGAGAPGFAGKTALDLAIERGDAALMSALTASAD